MERHGFYPLTRQPDRGWSFESEDQLHQMLGVGSFYLDEQILRPPIWLNSSARMPVQLTRTEDRIVACRHAHRLRVPPIADLDLMLKRIRGANDVIYLPAASG